MKVKRNFVKLIVPVIVASTILANGGSINSKIDSKKVLQFSEFGNRITSSQGSNKDFLDEKLGKKKSSNSTLAASIKTKLTDIRGENNVAGNGFPTRAFDSRRQGEQSIINNEVTELDEQTKQEYSSSSDPEYSGREPDEPIRQMEGLRENIVGTASNDTSYENDERQSEDSNWHVETFISEPQQSTLDHSRIATTTTGPMIDTSLIRNLTEGLFPTRHISSVALDRFFPGSSSDLDNNNQVGLNSSEQFYNKKADERSEYENLNTTETENISESYSNSPLAKSQTVSPSSSFYLKPSKRVERKYSLIDLIQGQTKSKPSRDVGLAQSTTSISKPEIVKNHEIQIGKPASTKTNEISQDDSPQSVGSRQVNLPIDGGVSYQDFFQTGTTPTKNNNFNKSELINKNELTAAASSSQFGGLVEKDNTFEFVQQTPSINNQNRNFLQKIVYHSTPFRPSNYNSSSRTITNSPAIQQSRQIPFRSELPKEKPIVSFAAPNELPESIHIKSSSKQMMRDENNYRNDPRGAVSASTRSESSTAKTNGSKDQPIKIGLEDSSKEKDYSHSSKAELAEAQNSKEGQAVSESPLVTRKEKLMFDLYEREIDQQIAQALYREMRKSAEMLVKSAATTASHPINNKFSSQPQTSSSFQQSQTSSWPSQASLSPQIDEFQLNPAQVDFLQATPEMYQELPTLSGSDLEPVVLPLMPAFSLDGVPAKDVLEPSLSQQSSVNWPTTLQLFPSLNNVASYQVINPNSGTKLRKFKGKTLTKPQHSVATTWPHYSSLRDAILKVQQSKVSPFLTNSLSYLYSNLPKAIWNHKRPPKEHKQMSRQPLPLPDGSILASSTSLFPSFFTGAPISNGSPNNVLKNLALNLPLSFGNNPFHLSTNSQSFNKPVLRHRNLPAIGATFGDILNTALDNMLTIQSNLMRPNSIIDPLSIYSNANFQILDHLLSRKSSFANNRLHSDRQKRSSSLESDDKDQSLALGTIDTVANIRNKSYDGSRINTCGSHQSTDSIALIPFPIVI